MEYRIKEEIFEDGRSVFTPQYKILGNPSTFIDLGVWKDQIWKSAKSSTFDGALETINEHRFTIPEKIKYHEID